MRSPLQEPRPPAPTVRSVLERLGVADAEPRLQKEAVADAAYSGRLNLRELVVMRQAEFLPYDKGS